MRSRRGAVAFIAAAVLVSAMLVSATPTSYEPPPMVANPVEHVDTLIGTGNGGKTVGEINNFPGPSVPFGMVQYSPDTVGNYAGYSHSNGRATGFSMTHASVGCPAFGDISMLPTTSTVGSEPWDASEEIAHDKNERGVPGYYTVRLPSAGVTAELTATNRTGVGPVPLSERSRGAVLRAPRRVAGRHLGGENPDRGRQHHDHRIGDQRRVLRQGQRLHGVLRDEVQQAVHVVRHLGRLRRISQRPQRLFELSGIQRGIRRVPGRLGSRGANRVVLRGH